MLPGAKTSRPFFAISYLHMWGLLWYKVANIDDVADIGHVIRKSRGKRTYHLF